MAIQATITTIQGIALPTAYINLATPQVSKVTNAGVNTFNLLANATVYASKAFYDADGGKDHPIEGFSVSCVADLTKSVYAQLYAELKLNTRLTNIGDEV